MVFVVRTAIVPVMLAILVGCNKRPSGGEIMIPLEENIPHADYPFVEMGKGSTGSDDELRAAGDRATLLARYLSTSDAFLVDTLDVLHSGHVVIRPLDSDRMLVLDTRAGTLFMLRLSNGVVATVAEAGEGPGELRYPRDLSISEGRLIVACAGRTAVVFDCGVNADGDCAYIEMLQLPISASSVAAVDGERAAYLGYTPVPSPGGLIVDRTPAERDAVHVVGREGTTQRSFAPMYDTEGHWMLLTDMSQGHVRYVPSSQSFVVAFRRFPFLYFHDASGALSGGVAVDDFTIGRQEYSLSSGSLTVVQTGFSMISDVASLRAGWVLVEVSHFDVPDDAAVGGRFVRDYYAVDVADSRGLFLGSTATLENQQARPIPIPGADVILLDVDGKLALARPHQ